MKKYIKLILKDYEEDELHLELCVSNEKFQGSHDFYVLQDTLKEFGQKLLMFSGSNQEAIFVYGGDNPELVCHIMIRAYSFNSSGHSAIEIIIDNHDDRPSFARAEFSIECAPADINRLGQLIVDWNIATHDRLDWSVYEK